MAALFYNGVVLYMMRTTNFSIEPVYDDNGVDWLYSRVLIEAVCVWNPQATGSGNPISLDDIGRPADPRNVGVSRANAGFNLGPADSLPVSLANLKEVLTTPRKYMLLSMGDRIDGQVNVSQVIEAPQYTLFNEQLACDCNNGPNPLYCRVVQVIGDKTAIVNYGIEAWISDNENIVLSNRWTVRSTTNPDGFSTLFYQGTAILRSDLMRAPDTLFTADNFRAAYFPDVPRQFKRNIVEASLSDDGTRLDYSLADTELALAIGDNSDISRVEGVVSAKVEYSADQWRSIGAEIIGDVAGPSEPLSIPEQRGHPGPRPWWRSALYGVGPALGGLFDLGGGNPLRGGAQLLQIANRKPQARSVATVRVWGKRYASKTVMATTALAVALERLNFQPGASLQFGSITPNAPTIVSLSLAQGIDERFVECQMVVIPPGSGILSVTQNPLNIVGMMKMANDVSGTFNAIPLDYSGGDSSTGAGPPIGVGGSSTANDRGTWLGSLLVQALGNPGLVPEPSPDRGDIDFPTKEQDYE